MATKWIKTNYPDITYREHPEKKYLGQPDRYYVIRYRKNGKRKAESVGWRSKGMTPKKASLLRDTITENIRLGQRPQSIEEMRLNDKEEQERKIKEQELQDKENRSLDSFAQEYFNWLKSNKKTYRSDKSRYDSHMKEKLGSLPLRSISPFHLEQLKRDISKKGLSDKTIHHCLSLIRTIFKKAIRWDQFEGKIPSDQIDFPTINNKRIRYLEQNEVNELLLKLENRSLRTHQQTRLALSCGLRFSEIANMCWGDINFKQSLLNLPETKAGESQQVPLPSGILAMLQEIIPNDAGPGDLIFPDKYGKPQVRVSNVFDKVVKELGYNKGVIDRRQRVVFHTLRHTFCSWLAIAGTPLYTIQRLARHKSISQTERYSHLCPDLKKDAINNLEKSFLEFQLESTQDKKVQRLK